MTYRSPAPCSPRRYPITLALVTITASGCPEPDRTDDDPTTDAADTGTSSSSTDTSTTDTPTTGATDDPTTPIDPSTSGDTTDPGASTGSSGTTDGTTTGGDPTGTSSSGDDTRGDSDVGTTRGDDATTDDTGEADDTTGDPVQCDPGDIADGPPSVIVDGALAVPIDIVSVDASTTMVYETKTTTTRATMKFRLGPEGGRPIFDLRQDEFTKIELDGVPLAINMVLHRDLGGLPVDEMRVITVDLPPCSEHVLELEYLMEGYSLGYWPLAGYANWLSSFLDAAPAHYLERWLPTNLIHDRFALTMAVQVLGSPSEQVVYSNGEIEELGFHHWKITYPDHFTSLSPFWAVTEAGLSEPSVEVLQPSQGDPVVIELHLAPGLDKAKIHADIAAYFEEFLADTGPYHHDRFLALMSTGAFGMEYEGAATTSEERLKLDLFHSWIGRGLKPRRSADGWVDAAWIQYAIDDVDTPVVPLTVADFGPVVLCSQNPWERRTPPEAYTIGEQVFATIAASSGDADLRLAMQMFYELYAPGLFDTGELEQHLYCELDDPTVRDVFHRWVYGNFGATPPPPPGYCP